jgi:hypothetical protein
MDDYTQNPWAHCSFLSAHSVTNVRWFGVMLHTLADGLGDAWQVGSWIRLKSLDLSHNKIPYLPESICNSTDVRKLHVQGNPLVQIPLSMGSMRNLRKFTFSGNNWVSPPQTVMQLKSEAVIEYLQVTPFTLPVTVTVDNKHSSCSCFECHGTSANSYIAHTPKCV